MKSINDMQEAEDNWVSFISEPALAEDWESDEDRRYDFLPLIPA